jgi:hypothetical protein
MSQIGCLSKESMRDRVVQNCRNIVGCILPPHTSQIPYCLPQVPQILMVPPVIRARISHPPTEPHAYNLPLDGIMIGSRYGNCSNSI